LYRVVLTNRASKGLEKAPEHVRKRSIEAIDALQQSFAPIKLFDVKKLKGYTDTFRIRIGDWRLIYELRRKEAMIVVLEIGPRGRVDY
jgi:mRNA interferase RelE/StbE